MNTNIITKSIYGLVFFFSLITASFADSTETQDRAFWQAKMHLMDQDSNTGFQIYRSERPDRKSFQQRCKLGIEEVWVLSGDADKAEKKWIKDCPGLKIREFHNQKVKNPLTETFLTEFDTWVEEARASGKKILFRCSCGCHRTGRLAAYYRLKFNNWSTKQAIDEMYYVGKWMFLFPALRPQVRAYADYLAGRKCSQKKKYCVKENKTTSKSESLQALLDQ